MNAFLKKMLAALGLAACLLGYQHALADVAPPEAPPGSTLWPGSETTQVRMAAETVTMTVSTDPADPQLAVARTTAVFSMLNEGSETEKMQVRFPLRFMMWEETRYPEIADLRVKVNGRSISTRRAVLTYTQSRELGNQEAMIPWSVFDVSFPPGEDVSIEVTYSVHGFGYLPWQAFRYILETGAGWKDTIGSADIVVKLPYEANKYNVWLDAQTGFSTTTSKAEMSGNEVRWHFDALEPTFEDNIEISLITPALWQKVLTERANVARDPNDGEAWGRLGKAYKEMTREAKGYPRTDPTGEELFRMSSAAYEKCLELLPKDSLWHAGYADLLWSRYYFVVHFSNNGDSESLLPRALLHLQAALALDPNNQLARDLLDEVAYSMPEAVQKNGSDYVLLALTPTPVPPTPYGPATKSPAEETAAAVTETEPPAVVTVEAATLPPPTPAPTKTSPVCGGAGLVLPLVGVGLWYSRRRSRQQ